jgi:hypothetical protein
MPQPVLNVSLEEIKHEIIRLIGWLERDLVRRIHWNPPLLVFAREFQTLADGQPLDAARIQDFISRLRQHIISHCLKGFDPDIWHAEALERLARGHHDA